MARSIRSDERRWSSATTISLALHGLLVLAVWFASSRWGAVVILIPDDDGPRFEPGAVLPIELATVELPAVDEPGVTRPEPDQPEPHEAKVEPRVPMRSVSREGEPQAAPTPISEAHDHQPGERAGLLGSGRETRGVEPRLVGGSQALVEESLDSGRSEGPSPRPSSPSPPSQDYAFERVGNKWVYHEPNGSFVATLRPDGGVDFRNKLIKVRPGSMEGTSRDGEEFVTLDVHHDAVGIVQVARGRDPSPRAKAQLLAATFEFRLEIATRYHKQRLIDQLGQIDDELSAIWNTSARSLSERKRLVFELWDGCEEPPGELEAFPGADISELDKTRRKLASAARRKIIRFIAEVAPAGSAEAYTDAELRSLNQRRVSEQMFAPYR